MKRAVSHWHWLLPVFLGLIVTEDAVHFFVMLEAGGLGAGQALSKIFEPFSWLSVPGYLFFTGFRIVPFALLAIITGLLGRKIRGAFLVFTVLGGLLGIFLFYLPATASVWWPLDVGPRMSSTAVLAFLFIPFYNVPYMIAGTAGGLAVTLFLVGLEGRLSKDDRRIFIGGVKIPPVLLAFGCLGVSLVLGLTLARGTRSAEAKQALLAGARSHETTKEILLQLKSDQDPLVRNYATTEWKRHGFRNDDGPSLNGANEHPGTEK